MRIKNDYADIKEEKFLVRIKMWSLLLLSYIAGEYERCMTTKKIRNEKKRMRSLCDKHQFQNIVTCYNDFI